MNALRRTALVALLFVSAPLVPGCATTAPRRNLTYSDRARRDYDAAMELYNAGEYQDSSERFTRIRRQYGLSRWAWLAELRLADIDFKQEKYTSAITAFRAWIRYHPTQPEVVYAQYMIARSYHAEIPVDWFLTPSSWERDQTSTTEAREALERFLRDHGDSQYAPEARRYLQRTLEFLARAEIRIGSYYASRGRIEAGISRFQSVLENYAGSGLEAEAMMKMGEAFLELGRRDAARQVFATLVQNHPRAGHAESARRYLRFLGPPRAPTTAPSAVASPAPAAE